MKTDGASGPIVSVLNKIIVIGLLEVTMCTG